MRFNYFNNEILQRKYAKRSLNIILYMCVSRMKNYTGGNALNKI